MSIVRYLTLIPCIDAFFECCLLSFLAHSRFHNVAFYSWPCKKLQQQTLVWLSLARTAATRPVAATRIHVGNGDELPDNDSRR